MGDEQGMTKRHRGDVHWRQDPVILARLAEVEKRHLRGEANVHIAAALGLGEGTIRRDIKRLNELWLERTADEVTTLRARAIRQLEEVHRRAIAAAEFDEMAERAVLYGEVPAEFDETTFRVIRDDKGSVQFRGAKAQALNVARQATMDIAKVQGLIVEKVAPTDGDGKTLDLLGLLRQAARARDGGASGSSGQ